MNLQVFSRRSLLQLPLFVIVFLLMREWLIAVTILTKSTYLNTFLLFVAFSLTTNFLQFKKWLTIPLKITTILYLVAFIYMTESFGIISALQFIVTDSLQNIALIFSGKWLEMSNAFRTILFFAVIWMTTYLLNYQLRVKRSIFLFYFLTVLFLAILDTFSSYDADKAIIRTVILGFLLAGLLKIVKLHDNRPSKLSLRKVAAFSVPLIVFITFATALAYTLPKYNPQWKDPVPYFQTLAKDSVSEGGNGIAKNGKVGYGEDDSNLGGAFGLDDTVVFEAIADEPFYTRIEHKSFYTGKGWIFQQEQEQIRTFRNRDIIETDLPKSDLPKENEANLKGVVMKLGGQSFPFVLAPYGLISVIAAEPEMVFAISDADQKIKTYNNDSIYEMTEYKLIYTEPQFSLKKLRESTPESLNQLPENFAQYLQLPSTLPQRVKDLAQEITANKDTVYDKASAIDRYFTTGGFSYDLMASAEPKGDTDFVDQFLFNTNRGYCNHFSTSMVVMLRSVGIPARWVKGFAEGELVGPSGDKSIYRVTNNEAHSWVEAYIPSVGWVPFEPTIGFNGSARINFDMELDIEEQQQFEEQEKNDKPKQTATTKKSNTLVEILDWISEKKSTFIKWFVALSAVTYILFKVRKKWMPKILIPYYRMRKPTWHTFEKQYYRLLKQLALYGLEKNDGETLMQFAIRVDQFFDTRDMRRLTKVFDEGFYGKQQTLENYTQLRKSWEYLINMTSG